MKLVGYWFLYQQLSMQDKNHLNLKTNILKSHVQTMPIDLLWFVHRCLAENQNQYLCVSNLKHWLIAALPESLCFTWNTMVLSLPVLLPKHKQGICQ